MRFLVDNALSPVLATLLKQAGHDALHVRALELHRSEDILIFERAASEDRILVSAEPSVIQFRGPGSRKPDTLARTLLSNLAQLAEALESGSIVTFEPSRVRVRALPISSTSTNE